MDIRASILISSYNRKALFARTVWAIANRPPSVPFEVVVVDDGSTENVLGELKLYSSVFPWKFVRFDSEEFAAKTGIKKFHNNPCTSQNVAFKQASPTSEYIFQQGNEVIPWLNVYDQLIADTPKDTDHYLAFSTTFDVPKEYLDILDVYGANLTPGIVKECEKWPLQCKNYPGCQDYLSDVTNYISLTSRKLWEKIGGFDERYFGGISAEDSDFVRRARCTPGFKQVISQGISLHQFHGGRTRYYWPKEDVISRQRFEDGCAINRCIFDDFIEGTYSNQQRFPWGTYGIKEVITNVG